MRVTLEAARRNAGFSQKEAAKELNISRDSLRFYEQYKKSPRIDLAIKMAQLQLKKFIKKMEQEYGSTHTLVYKVDVFDAKHL